MESILIKNGFVIDGTGAPGVQADVLIEGGRIKKIGPISESADQVIDAKGRVVCPGFVDIHRHCDILPFYDKGFGRLELTQGITTEAVGNCGISMTPYPEDDALRKEVYDFQAPVIGPPLDNGIRTYPQYAEAMDHVALPVNMASMVGTGSVQLAVKGFTDRPWTQEELDRGRAIIEESLLAGAVGVTLGIMYLPECYTTADEYAYILEPVGRLGKFIAAHIRGEGDSMVASIREIIGIARKAGCALEVSHFKSCGMDNWRKDVPEAIKLIEQARAEGMDVTCDFYPYEGGSTGLNTMIPPVFVAGDMGSALARLGTPEGVAEYRRTASIRHHPNWDNFCVSVGWDRIILADVKLPEHQKMIGMSVAEAAEKFGYEDGYALAAHLLHSEDGRTAIINMTMCQDDIDTIARLPYASVISDTICAPTDHPHPRSYGAFPKIIREYVRERKIYSLEEGIRRMTSLPAARIGLRDRGRLAEGCWADINIFDPDVFRDNSTFLDSTREATGLDWCLVNGQPVIQEGQYHADRKAGMNLRIR